jgi:drug/metabolite transporter (DMT)-like permease
MPRSFAQHTFLALIALGLLLSQMLLKIGVGDEPIRITRASDLLGLLGRILTTPALFFGYLLSGLVAIVWLVALSRMPLSHAVPLLTAFYYLLLLLASSFVLGESVGLRQWLGSVLIVLAIALMSRPTP